MSWIDSKMGENEWTLSDLPEELINLVANRLSNSIELRGIRGICKPWRSALATQKGFPKNLRPKLSSFRSRKIFPTTFFRVTHPSSCSSSKGGLIRTRKNNLLSPLSRQLITPSNQTIDLLKFAVSEISQSYQLGHWSSQDKPSRVILLDNMFFVVHNKRILCCKKGEETIKGWTRIEKEVENIWGKNEVDDVTDIILHKGRVYALDLNGGIWWISLSTLTTAKYAPSTPLEHYEIDSCKEKRLVEYCGELCVVHRFCKSFRVDGESIERTIGYKVYKMDENLAKWVIISSLGDNSLIMTVDSCFTVTGSEYYRGVANSIYFTDAVEDHCKRGMNVEDVKMFKIDDGSIITMTDSSTSQSCFHMFTPPFL